MLWLLRRMMLDGGAGAPIEGQDDPEFQAPDAEAILSRFDENFDEMPEAPDGGKPPAPKPPPKDDEPFDWQKEHLRTGDEPEPAPAPKPAETPEEVVTDEYELLKKYGLDGKFENVEAAMQAFQGRNAQIERFGGILRDQGYEVSDDVLADIVDNMERQQAAKKAPFLFGQPEPPAAQPAPQPPQPQPQPAQPPAAKQPGVATYKFLETYRQRGLDGWDANFLSDLAGALQEMMQMPEIPKTDGLASREELQGMAALSRQMFRDLAVTEHIADRVSRGEKLPNNYRQQLLSQIERNPQLVERALVSYATRGRYNGFMDEYARGIPALPAEQEALAAEQEKLKREKAQLSGGAPPAQPGGKEKQPSIEDMEAQIENLGRLI